MTGISSRLEQIVHALIAPIAAILAAVGVQRRHDGTPESHDMVEIVERNVARLRTTTSLLMHHAEVVEDDLVIRVPIRALEQITGVRSQMHQSNPPPLPRTLPPPSEFHPTGECVLLVIPAERSETVIQPLREAGFSLLMAADYIEGVDLARASKPVAIVIDAGLGHWGHLMAQILADDPDTKMIPQLLVDTSNNGVALAPKVLLPRHLPQSLREIIAVWRNGPTAQPSVLLVDNDPDVKGLIANHLRADGFAVQLVSYGAEALQIARGQRFDLILLDLLLPDLDGFTVLGGLRAQSANNLTPIILISALDTPQEKIRGLQLGADDFITKPFIIDELLARIHASMRRSELEGGANPSTRLPGNIAIERAIALRIEQQRDFTVCYGDLDNFKAYNDTYGFLKGDAVILRTAQLLTEAVRRFGNPDDFVGHIGGDDFVIITTPNRVRELCDWAIARFDEVAPLFYDPDARARRSIAGLDRLGRPVIFPLVSLSFAVVGSDLHRFSHPGEVAQRSVAPKKRAKRLPGSVIVFEE